MTQPAEGLLEAAQRLLGAHVRPLEGGYSGETFLVGTDEEEVVLRFYLRDPARAAVDAALLRLMRGLVPVPEVLELRESVDGEKPAHLVVERLPGRRLDLVRADPATPVEVRRRAGREVGTLLVRLSGVPFPAHGWFSDAELRVEPMPGPGIDLPAMVAAHRDSGAFLDWPVERIDALAAVAEDAQRWVDLPSRYCLAHSDVNAKNLLVDPESGALTGVVDWEFAFAGTPYVDIGNLLRFETDQVFGQAAVAAYLEGAAGVGTDFLERARAIDMFALVELAARSDQHAVTRQAAGLLGQIAVAGTLQAGRVDWRAGLS